MRACSLQPLLCHFVASQAPGDFASLEDKKEPNTRPTVLASAFAIAQRSEGTPIGATG